MNPTQPVELYHSWPLFEQAQQFELGLDCPVARLPLFAELMKNAAELAQRGIGVWECDLATSSLSWSVGVYDIFGLPRDAGVSRDDVVALYCEHSRCTMERLRAHAIKHRRGFTLDAQICPSMADRRWMRLIAAPVCDNHNVTRLQGLKLLI